MWLCAVCCTSQIHDKLRQYEKHSPTPVLHSASCLAEDVGAILFNISQWDKSLELNNIAIKCQQNNYCNAWEDCFLILNHQLAEELQNGAMEDDERELLLLLTTPHLKVLPHIYIYTFSFLQVLLISLNAAALSAFCLSCSDFPLSWSSIT